LKSGKRLWTGDLVVEGSGLERPEFRTRFAGFEEWRAVVGPNTSTPDGGNTLVLLGSALLALGLVSRRCKVAMKG
jgi:hypothetical protein